MMLGFYPERVNNHNFCQPFRILQGIGQFYGVFLLTLMGHRAAFLIMLLVICAVLSACDPSFSFSVSVSIWPCVHPWRLEEGNYGRLRNGWMGRGDSGPPPPSPLLSKAKPCAFPPPQPAPIPMDPLAATGLGLGLGAISTAPASEVEPRPPLAPHHRPPRVGRLGSLEQGNSDAGGDPPWEGLSIWQVGPRGGNSPCSGGHRPPLVRVPRGAPSGVCRPGRNACSSTPTP